MNKYNKAIENIKTTPEMKERVLKNIYKNETSIFSKFQKNFGVILAACLMLFVGLRFIQPTPVQDTSKYQEFETLSRLNESLGFEMRELADLPINPNETRYINAFDIGRIAYISGEQDITINHSKIKGEDITGIYEEYSQESKVLIDSFEVQIKGHNDLVYIATWENEQFTFALTNNVGLTLEQVTKIISKYMK